MKNDLEKQENSPSQTEPNSLEQTSNNSHSLKSPSQINTNPSSGDHFDVQIGNVEKNAQIAVGKSITQQIQNIVQTVNLKAMFVSFFFVFFFLGVILFVLLRPEPKPPEMVGSFNIAVAAFDELIDEQSVPSKEGEQLASWLEKELSSQEESFPHGHIVRFWGPELTGRISGITQEIRALEAQKRAEEIKAHVLIYGVIENQGGSNFIKPEFFVSSAGFKSNQEVTGPHRLGSEVSIPTEFHDNPASIANANRELNSRSLALAYFTIGLSHFVLNDFEGAYAAFNLAKSVPDWEDEEGKEVVYLFLGNAALNLASLDEAHTWFDTALEANDQYARAYIGRGFTFFQEAIKPMPDEPADLILLDKATYAFQAGLNASDKPENADVDAKVHFGLGRIHLLKNYQEGNDFYEEAEKELLQVTNAYEAGNVHLPELAAQSYGLLGEIYYMQHDDKNAIYNFEQAIELSQQNEAKDGWIQRLQKIHAAQNNSESTPIP